MHPVRPLALALVLLLVLIAPRAAAEDAPVAPAKPEAETPAPTKAAPKPAAAGVEVKLLAAGAEPRAGLRYKPQAGTQVEFSTSIVTEVESPMGAMTIGPIKTTVRATFGTPTKAGIPVQATITDSVLEADAANPFAAQMRSGIEEMKGTAIRGTLSPHGRWTAAPAVDAAGPDAPAGGTPATREALASQMVMIFLPLPAEAVGVGGRWTVRTKVRANRVEQTALITATLVEVTGSRIQVRYTETRSAKDATMEANGMKIEIPSIDGKGSGTATLDLALCGVVKNAGSVEVDMVMNMMGQELTNSSVTKSTSEAKAVAATTRSAPTKDGAK